MPGKASAASRCGAAGCRSWAWRPAARRLREAGLGVSGLNRAGPLLADGWRDDARRAIDEAHAIGAGVLMLFAGGLPQGSKDLPGARARVGERIAELLPQAREAGVTLALEPLHPIYAAERSVLSTLAQANELIESLGDPLGLVVDAYHVWWDPALAAEISRGRIVGFHVSDWLVPTRDPLVDRGMPGDGVIDLAGMRQMVESTGYAGWIEVELFSERWWAEDPATVTRLCRERTLAHL